MHTIEYNEESEKFELLFAHGTSDAYVQSILHRGVIQPDFHSVLDAVLATAPNIDKRNNAIHDEIIAGPLSIGARQQESDVVFAARLAIPAAISLFAEEGLKVCEHGGEVYADAWKQLSRHLNGRSELPKRFPGAKPYMILFRVPVQPAGVPRMKYNEAFWSGTVLSSILKVAGHCHPLEVKFLDPLPPSMICWNGSCADALKEIEGDMMSPRAREKLIQINKERDPWDDIDGEPSTIEGDTKDQPNP
jgi:hypothetical protein